MTTNALLPAVAPDWFLRTKTTTTTIHTSTHARTHTAHTHTQAHSFTHSVDFQKLECQETNWKLNFTAAPHVSIMSLNRSLTTETVTLRTN